MIGAASLGAIMRRYFLRTLTIILAALLIPAAARSQTNIDSVRIARLAALSRLWGVVKYFHPAFLYRRVAWDSATLVAIDRTNSAKTPGEFEAATNEMLAVLGDPATHVRRKAQPAANDNRTWSWGRRWEVAGSDSTLVISIPDFDQWQRALQTLDSAVVDLKRANSVVFDLRGPQREVGTSPFVFGNVNRYLPSSSLSTPAQRRRMHSGFIPETGITSGGYWSGVFEQAGEVINVSTPNRSRRIVFLGYPGSDFPPVAFALRNSGQGSIVVEGNTRQLAAGASTYTVALGDGLEGVVRIGEMSGGVDADTALTRQSGQDTPLQVALFLTKQPIVAPTFSSSHSAYVPGPDSTCAKPSYPSNACRVLAAFRWWNAIHYFYPYKHLIGTEWSSTLPGNIRNLEAARDSLEYVLAVAEMTSRLHDSHGFLTGSNAFGNFLGMVPVAVQVQYIGTDPVVISVADDSATKASGIAVGDVILSVDGEEAAARRARKARYLAYSTPQALTDRVGSALLFGSDSTPARVTVRDRSGRVRTLTLPRRAGLGRLVQYPRTGPMLKMLPGNIGYADLSLLPVSAVDSMFEMFRNTKAIILDDRGYPQGTAWAIAPRLTDKDSVAAASFRRPLVMSPDSAEWTTYEFVQYTPSTTKWKYRRKTVLLVDERTMSQAEHTGLFFEAANKTTIIGSPTAGANGDITSVVLPGELVAWFSGHDVRHADGRQLQRMGLQPDIVVRPTLAGIRAGHDEVLERALEFLKK